MQGWVRGASGLPVLIGLVGGLLMSPSLAPSQPRDMACQALAAWLLAGRTTPRTEVSQEADGCVATHLRFSIDRYRGWAVERLAVSGPQLDIGKDRPLPTSLRLEARGVRFAPELEDARARYLIQLQQRPLDVRLRYDWDKATQQLHLRELALDSPRRGLVALSMDADLKGFDKRMPSLQDLGVRRVRMVLDNDGLFEDLLAPVVIGLTPDGEDPAVAIPKVKAREIQRLRALPRAMLDETSRDAMIRFVDDFPHPKGRLEIEQILDKPLQLRDLKSAAAIAPTVWLSGSKLTARYDTSTSRYATPKAPVAVGEHQR